MPSSNRAKWIEAGTALAVDPSRVVRCPECSDGTLMVHDVAFGADPPMLERWLVCDACNAQNSIRMRASKASDA